MIINTYTRNNEIIIELVLLSTLTGDLCLVFVAFSPISRKDVILPAPLLCDDIELVDTVSLDKNYINGRFF